MANPFLAEIRIFPFNFAPIGWAICNGQILAISQNTALFSLLGTNYGGDGRTTFGLPNLQDSAVLSPGQGAGLSPYNVGDVGGSISQTLLTGQMPVHTHTASAYNGKGNQTSPTAHALATPHILKASDNTYATTAPNTTMNAAALVAAGGTQPHENRQPFLVFNFCIALQGVFPPRS